MTIDPVLPVWAALILLLTAASVMIFLEFKRRLNFPALRIAGVIIITIAIAIILFRPKYRSTTSTKILLLTENYDRKVVDSLLNISAFSLRHYGSPAAYKGSTSMMDYDLLQDIHHVKVVAGNGLPTDFLDKIQDSQSQFVYVPSKLPSGISDLSISKCEANRICQITGELRSNSACSLYVEGPGGAEDSVKFSEGGIHRFTLNVRPKLAGTFIYNLRLQYNDEKIDDLLPLKVNKGKSLKILFLQQHPSFENNSLKSYLEKQNHQLAIRYQISKAIHRSEFINHSKINLTRITPDILNSFDLLISDSPTLVSMTRSEQNAIVEAVENGLGLLNTNPALPRRNDFFFPFEFGKVHKDTVREIVNNEKMVLPTSSLRVVPSSSINITKKDDAGVVSGYTTVGLGKIGFQLIQETFPIMLAGDSVAYADLWTPLLEGVAKANFPSTRISILTPFPWYEHHPIDIMITSALDSIPAVSSDGVSLPLLEDAFVDNVWYTRTWAGKPGWHRFESKHDTVDYWVSSRDSWTTLSLANQIKENLSRSADNISQTQTDSISWKELPAIIPYLMILLTSGFLWLAPKL